MLRSLAHASGVRGRAAIVVMKNFDIYIGNESTDPMNLEASELFGFNVGMFVEKLVEGLRTTQFSGLLRCILWTSSRACSSGFQITRDTCRCWGKREYGHPVENCGRFELGCLQEESALHGRALPRAGDGQWTGRNRYEGPYCEAKVSSGPLPMMLSMRTSCLFFSWHAWL